VKEKLGKPVTAHCEKMQVVTTSCHFQCFEVEVCALLSNVALVGLLSYFALKWSVRPRVRAFYYI